MAGRFLIRGSIAGKGVMRIGVAGVGGGVRRESGGERRGGRVWVR